jgi:succinate dehydrogenase / fumarate reductase iron-sulfur subunit
MNEPADIAAGRQTVQIRIKRQDAPDQPSRWEDFSIPRRANMNVISVLQWITAHPIQADGKAATPPAYEASCLEEVCGACSMVINGRVRPACSALVDQISSGDAPIILEPMSKFPLIRDLIVDTRRLFDDLKRVKAWVPIDGTYDLGPGAAESRSQQESRYPLSRCITCACCMEACPQFTPVNKFVGAAVISQARLFNDHPVGKELKAERLEVLMGEGGLQDCGKAGNCVEVCPRQIPLLESIAVVQRQATAHSIKRFFSA